jgi:CubicO group peptidase (beta-lactamase class C family)
MPGCIALVARDGRTHLDVIGTRTFGDAEPLQRNDVFRITSMTKPITAAAVMTLVEDGSRHLDAPVDDLLPELANRRVLRSIDADLDDTVPAKRAITLEDLLTRLSSLGLLGRFRHRTAERGTLAIYPVHACGKNNRRGIEVSSGPPTASSFLSRRQFKMSIFGLRLPCKWGSRLK